MAIYRRAGITRSLEVKVMSVAISPPKSVHVQLADLGPSEKLQRSHYNQIAEDYEKHYSDPFSIEYRRRFIYVPMLQGIDLSEMTVLDAMCGSGQTTAYLLGRNAKVTGLDISTEAIGSYRTKWSECDAIERSLLDSGIPANSFDLVVVVGGLHHMHPNVSRAVSEIHRVLKPGGYFCFMEPHSNSVPDLVRRFWYKYDRFFSANEAAIDVHALQREFASRFKPVACKYMGNVGFLFVLNSLIFRIPLQAKRLYSPLLMKLESLIGMFQGRLTSCFVVAQWQKY